LFAYELVGYLQDLVKFDLVLHLDEPVSVDKSLKVDAKHVRKLINQLFMPSAYFSAVLLVIMNHLVVEVRLKAVLECLSVFWYFKVEDIERLVGLRNVLGTLHVELSPQYTTKDIPDQARAENLLLVLLNRGSFKLSS
jgi:hypothetical protein